MHTTNSLINDLSEMGLKGDETLLVHSSMKSIGDVNGGADAVLDAFQRFFASGLLVFPTFTYLSVTTRKPLFDATSSIPRWYSLVRLVKSPSRISRRESLPVICA